MGRERSHKSKSRRRERSARHGSQTWEYPPQTVYAPLRDGEGYYTPAHGEEYLSQLAYMPSSASYPCFLETHPRIRSPSRIPQFHNAPEEMEFVNGPLASSSQSYANSSAKAFVNEFLGPSSGQSVYAGGTPEFGEHYAQEVARDRPHKLFRVLESFKVPEVSLNAADVVSQLLAERFDFHSVMWSGVLTGSKLDKNYKIILALMEKALVSVIDETVRSLRDNHDAVQLAVFIRRLYTIQLPNCGKLVEKWICDYHAKNFEAFYREGESDEWDAEDEAREKELDQLDEELEELKAEIENWERIERNYLAFDEKAALFIRSKRLFEQRLLLIESVPVESTSAFLEGGFDPNPALPAWEHPEVREKHRLRAVFQAELDEIISSDTLEIDKSMGIPPNGFCFEPGVVKDSRWDQYRATPWEAIFMEEDVENLGLAASPMDDKNASSRSHRLSLDALKAFN